MDDSPGGIFRENGHPTDRVDDILLDILVCSEGS
jgi:hypothetical protein